jgi:hypothetical protein
MKNNLIGGFMKVSYSKMILSGVIASTFFAVSCQKKGVTKGVQPQTAIAADNSPTTGVDPAASPQPDTQVIPEIKPKDSKEVPRKPVEALPKLEPKGVTPPKPIEITVPEIDIDITSADHTKVTPKTSKKPAKTISGDQTEVKPEAKKEDKKIEAEQKVAEKVETKSDDKSEEKSEIKDCSADVLALGNENAKIYTKAVQVDKDIKSTVTEKTNAFSKFLKQCKAWKTLFAKEKNESCAVSTSDKMLATTKTWDKSGMFIGEKLKEITGQDNEYSLMADKIAADVLNLLKAEKLVVSEIAKPLFEKDNQYWKMFIVDGELQTDSRKLLDAVKAKKVACTLIANPEKYDDATKVTVSITSVDAYIPKEAKSEVQTGVDFNIEIKTESKAKTKAENLKAVGVPAIMSCSNLSMNKLDIKALKSALGMQLKAELK